MNKEVIDLSIEKEKRYQEMLPQLEALIAEEEDTIANLANIAAVLKSTFDFFWVGFYRKINGELVLGPFQGPIACSRISFNRGVCGKAYRENRTIVVEDVHLFEDHIACNENSQSEIVIPITMANEVVMVLDVDSDQKNYFDNTDQFYLEKVCTLIEKTL